MLPQPVGGGLPAGGVGIALGAQVLGALRGLWVGGMGASTHHHLPQLFRVFQHRAGAQHVVVEGLSVVIGHEHRPPQAVQQGFFPDVGVGVVDEYAGVHVAVGIDVEITPATGNTPAHILPVILEVQQENGLGVAVVVPHPVVQLLSLLWSRQQLGGGVVAHGHIVEVPGELGPPRHQAVYKVLRTDGFHVGAGVTAGHAEGQLLGLEDVHSMTHLLEYPLSPAAVSGLFEAFHADGGDEVFHPEHLVGECLVNEGGVGKAQKLTIVVLVAQGDQVVPAHHRLPAGIDVDVHSQLLTLGDDAVNLVKAQVQLVAVFRRPTAGAVQVAGRGGIQQNGPGDVAAVFRPGLLLFLPSDQVAVQNEIFKKGPTYPIVDVCPHALDEPVPVVVGILYHSAERGTLVGKTAGAVAGELVHPVH